MNKLRIPTITTALCAFACALALPAASLADTIAWWHFDEGTPGAKAAASTIAPDQAPALYAAPEAMSGTTVYAAGSAEYEASACAPTYTKPFRGRVIYDPISDAYRTNSAAMRFATAKGTYSAYYGGSLKIPGTKSLYDPISESNQITVEAFVCTTGGTFNTFGPIAGSVDSNFLGENWSICTEETGQIFVRLMGGTYRGNDNSYKKVNDGAWHHVAFTFNGTDVKVYVDHVHDRTISNVGKTMSFGDNNATYIGGYDTFANSSGATIHGCRRFPGVIDEVRVSNAALTPDQFLRMRPSADTNVILQISFDPDEYEAAPSTTKNFNDVIDPSFQVALYKTSSGAACVRHLRQGRRDGRLRPRRRQRRRERYRAPLHDQRHGRRQLPSGVQLLRPFFRTFELHPRMLLQNGRSGSRPY